MKVGLIKAYFDGLVGNEVKTAFAEAIRTLRSIGMKIEEVDIPHIDLVPAVQTCTSRVESTSDRNRYLRTRPRDYSLALLYTQISAFWFHRQPI